MENVSPVGLIRDLLADGPVTLTILDVQPEGLYSAVVAANSDGAAYNDSCVLADALQVPVKGEEWTFSSIDEGYPFAVKVEPVPEVTTPEAV